MVYEVNAHLGKTGELYKNIDCPRCSNPMEITEMFDKVTNNPPIVNFCVPCKVSVPEKNGQRFFHKVATKEDTK